MNNTRTLYFLFLSACLMILSGCAGQPRETDRPDWITGNSKAYPTEQYLIGRGEAEHAAVARDRARADLAKVFEVNINEQSRDITEYSHSTAGDQAQSSVEASVTRQISTRTEQTLSHIQIADIWQNPETGQHHALAVLDRLKAGQQLREEIRQLDATTARAISAARSESQLLRRLGQASQAVEAQLQRRALQRQLQVVDPTGSGVPEKYSLPRLLQDRNALAQRIRIDTTVVQDNTGQLATLIDGALANAGFRTANSNPNYRLEASLDLNQFTDQNWHWVHGTLSLNLVSLDDQSVQGNYRWEIKQAASQPTLARQRALDRLGDRLDKELYEVIIGFAQAR